MAHLETRVAAHFEARTPGNEHKLNFSFNALAPLLPSVQALAAAVAALLGVAAKPMLMRKATEGLELYCLNLGMPSVGKWGGALSVVCRLHGVQDCCTSWGCILASAWSHSFGLPWVDQASTFPPRPPRRLPSSLPSLLPPCRLHGVGQPADGSGRHRRARHPALRRAAHPAHHLPRHAARHRRRALAPAHPLPRGWSQPGGWAQRCDQSAG